MGGGVETGTTSSRPSNPMVDSTLTNLLGGLSNEYAKSTATGVNSTLDKGWEARLGAANDPDYARGVSGGTSELADIASGSRFGMNDPGYAALRAKAGDDTLRDVNSMFTASGRFGSGSHVGTATEALGNVNAGMDYQNYQNDQQRQMQAISALPGQFGAAQAPGDVWGAVGQEKQQQPWWALNNASSVLAGTAGAGGSTTTESQPWWKVGTGLGATALGFM